MCYAGPILISMSVQANLEAVPMIGAEVFIEPGQTPEEIEGWFRIMRENGMTITRIRMFESYMHQPDDSWDFTLFDYAFKAGEKYNIKIYVNLFPATSFTDVGGFKFPTSEENLASIANYIRHLVLHFKQFKSLYGWVPINEPGNEKFPQDEFAEKAFAEWKSRQVKPTYNSNGYQHFDFAEERFLVDYNTWFLDWLIKEIHKYDPGKPVHVNNHNIFQNAAEYDFPAWRNFLTSLGGSAHASWHFEYFTRQQYTVALSANSEMLRSGAGPIPWLMTELQGGNNTYSGNTPLCPTKEEITQWLWTTIFTGSKGSVFWCLNPRSSGIEAGEWAMVNYQDEPSDRLIAAAQVAKFINENEETFSDIEVVESDISVLYTRESLWIEKKLQMPKASFEGREIGGVMKSALGYFEALTEMGLQVSFQEMREYDFEKDDYTGKVIILAHQISIPSGYWPLLENFVAGGGKLIADGLTAYYDEYGHCILRRFPLQKLFGGDIKEYKVVTNLFQINVDGQNLPAHLWQGSISPTSATTVATANGETVAVRNTFGKGEVLWIPSLVGLGARISRNYEQFTKFLAQELRKNSAAAPVVFKQACSNIMMKTIRSGVSYFTCIINKSKEKQRLSLQINQSISNPNVVFADQQGQIENNTVVIESEETIILRWE